MQPRMCPEKNRGFGFVQFENEEDARAAMENMNGTPRVDAAPTARYVPLTCFIGTDAELFGKVLRVSKAKPAAAQSNSGKAGSWLAGPAQGSPALACVTMPATRQCGRKQRTGTRSCGKTGLRQGWKGSQPVTRVLQGVVAVAAVALALVVTQLERASDSTYQLLLKHVPCGLSPGPTSLSVAYQHRLQITVCALLLQLHRAEPRNQALLLILHLLDGALCLLASLSLLLHAVRLAALILLLPPPLHRCRISDIPGTCPRIHERTHLLFCTLASHCLLARSDLVRPLANCCAAFCLLALLRPRHVLRGVLASGGALHSSA